MRSPFAPLFTGVEHTNFLEQRATRGRRRERCEESFDKHQKAKAEKPANEDSDAVGGQARRGLRGSQLLIISNAESWGRAGGCEGII